MITIEIKKQDEEAFIDRTNQVADFNLSMGTTKEATTGRLIIEHYGSKYKPTGEDAVQMLDGEDVIFSGFIVNIKERLGPGHVIEYDCTIKDKIHLLDRKLVNTTYSENTPKEIIDDIVANFSAAGITTENVQAGGEIKFIAFNNVPPSEAIQQLADILGNEWYIDPDGDIHFFSKFNEDAPFNLTDTNDTYIFNSLELQEDFTQIRNSIIVEAGEELSTLDHTDNFLGDGTQHTFAVSKKYRQITVTVDGAGKSVGIANIDTFADRDCLYDFNLRQIYFDPTSPPAADDEIVVSGKFLFPIGLILREPNSITKFGERQILIQDKSIGNRTDALQRASAEVQAYSNNVREGKFTTNKSGLRPGQRINIQSDIRNINRNFIIQRMHLINKGPGLAEWDVALVSVKTYEIIDLLAQIIQGTRQERPQDQVIVNAERVGREVGVNREKRQHTDDPPIFVAGPFAPSDIDVRTRVAFADTRCITQ